VSHRSDPRAWAIYLVTDRTATGDRTLLDAVRAALAGGVGAVQLREPALSTRDLLALAEALRVATARAGAALLINDRVDVALACGADGVHLPSHGMTVREARALLGPAALIGVSTHAPGGVAAAAAAGADFAVVGPVFDTPSKRAYGAPLGLQALAAARAAAPRLPLFAIGGVDASNAASVRRHGADGIAVIRAVLAAANPTAAARALRA
jgi:thiamine-phosphate pyrophosphorylase